MICGLNRGDSNNHVSAGSCDVGHVDLFRFRKRAGEVSCVYLCRCRKIVNVVNGESS